MPLNVDIVLPIGSVTKQFTAAAVFRCAIVAITREHPKLSGRLPDFRQRGRLPTHV